MTAGTTTRSVGRNRISLPRAGLGALLAGTLLAGTLLGAAAYAGINAATNSAAVANAVVVAPLPHEHDAVRNARIRAGNGPLVGDSPRIPVGTTVNRSESGTQEGIGGHAPGHGPLP
jgi:hypothetical protein